MANHPANKTDPAFAPYQRNLSELTLAIRAGCIMKRIGEHAVVIGASMGGLLAARALADFYEQVTVLERDAFPVADIPRKGVPQGKHAHGLLARGRAVIADRG
jgi:pimeloyl-ACP methyl ester carboxylesterase